MKMKMKMNEKKRAEERKGRDTWGRMLNKLEKGKGKGERRKGIFWVGRYGMCM